MVERALGAGGMGTVWVAVQEPPPFADPERLARWLRGFDAAGRG